jgi:2-methylcitrate dehydratase PrpD
MLCLLEDARKSPQNAVDARCNPPFSSGIALSNWAVTLSDFTPEFIKGSKVLAMAQKVKWRFEKKPKSGGIELGVIGVRVKGDHLFSVQADFAYGHF